MTIAHNLGFPRIGAQRELKRALEKYWRGDCSLSDLVETGRELRVRHWKAQRDAGIELVPVGDFAFYDHVLNTTLLFGAEPKRFGFSHDETLLDRYFACARGTAGQPAMEMTKWFDTNYHYIVPEFLPDTVFTLQPDRLLGEIAEARALGIQPKVVLLGPLTYLRLGKEKAPGFNRLSLVPRLTDAYRQLLDTLADHGVEWVQIDEPALVLDLEPEWVEAYRQVFDSLGKTGPRILLATYFGSVAEHAAWIKTLPVAGIHLDAVRSPEQVGIFAQNWPADRVLSVGVVDGRNIWRTDLNRALDLLAPLRARYGDKLWVAPSCSLLHVPIDLSLETELDPEIREWLAFAHEKLAETAALARGLREGIEAIEEELLASDRAHRTRLESSRVHLPEVKRRLAGLQEADQHRASAFSDRIVRQRARLGLPPLPTTTIGSFPQTEAIRKARAAFRKGELSDADYQLAMQREIQLAVTKQEALGIDVLVHGEAERNDMVEYFGELLDGFAFTQHGWVQSYGSRCVKPPIIFGDVARPRAMTVEWAKYAQSLTSKPMKGMLTGPVTILQWSFVRDDQPRSVTATQIALAIRDEVTDLERAGIRIIQIDEPAFREGLPLRQKDWADYLGWAVYAFRLSASGVEDETQIHTHMCYSEFNDILPAIAALDADVITIETSRSDMELLDGFSHFAYPNEIGPGVYDIHSPRVPAVEEMTRLLDKARRVIPSDRLWVNPDCGLKTRNWAEVEAALANMVEAAKRVRAQLEPVRAAG